MKLRAAALLAVGVVPASCGFDAAVFESVPAVTTPPLAEAGADASVDSPPGGGTAFAVSAGQTFTCALRGGRASCWGSNVAGGLGTGDYLGHASPSLVSGGHVFDAITSGGTHACAIETGTLRAFCWGGNSRGQLGTGDTDPRLVPTAVVDLDPVVQIAAGYDFTCAVTRDGALYCWGEDHEGQLAIADVNVEMSTRPVRASADPFRRVAGGQGHTCAIRTSGVLACWGRNTSGQLGLGDGQPIQVRTPGSVGTKTDWTTLDLGQDSTCAIDDAGALFCWGDNSSSELGIAGAPASVTTPTVVGAGLAWEEVSVDAFDGCARGRDASLWCWGRNAEGQLGLGDANARPSPTRVAGPAWTSISVGRFHSCVGATPSLVACSGDNSVGELGVGDNDRRQTFTEVALP